MYDTTTTTTTTTLKKRYPRNIYSRLLVKDGVKSRAEIVCRMQGIAKLQVGLLCRMDRSLCVIMMLVKHGLILGVVQCMDRVGMLFFTSYGLLLVGLISLWNWWNDSVGPYSGKLSGCAAGNDHGSKHWQRGRKRKRKKKKIITRW